jgi:hypothetical protein
MATTSIGTGETRATVLGILPENAQTLPEPSPTLSALVLDNGVLRGFGKRPAILAARSVILI